MFIRKAKMTFILKRILPGLLIIVAPLQCLFTGPLVVSLWEIALLLAGHCFKINIIMYNGLSCQ